MRSVFATFAACALATQAHAVPLAGTALGSFGGFDPGLGTAAAVISNQDAAGLATFAIPGAPATTIAFDGYGSDRPGGFSGSFDAPFAIGAVAVSLGASQAFPATGASVVLTTVLSFTAPVAVTRTLTFTLDIGLFPGFPSGTDLDLFGTADVFPATFDYAGRRYDLAIVGFDPDGFTNDLTVAAQDSSYRGQLFAQITPDPAPIPEPASLLLLALPALAVIRRPR